MAFKHIGAVPAGTSAPTTPSSSVAARRQAGGLLTRRRRGIGDTNGRRRPQAPEEGTRDRRRYCKHRPMRSTDVGGGVCGEEPRGRRHHHPGACSRAHFGRAPGGATLNPRHGHTRRVLWHPAGGPAGARRVDPSQRSDDAAAHAPSITRNPPHLARSCCTSAIRDLNQERSKVRRSWPSKVTRPATGS